MKKIYTLFVLFTLCCFKLTAQWYSPIISHAAPPSFDSFINQPGVTLAQIIDTLDALRDTTDTSEGGAKDQLETFTNYWTPRVVANDSSGINMFAEYYISLHREMSFVSTSCADSGVFSGSWQLAGPDSIPGHQTMGYMNCIWGDPIDTNYILAGSENGGLFKTTDGGKNWTNITSNSPWVTGAAGVACIAVNPLNNQTIFLGTKVGVGAVEYGAGILESYDGGNTWMQEFVAPTGTWSDTIQEVRGVYFSPDSTRIYAFTPSNIYTRYNVGTGNLWIDITPPGGFPKGTDLKFVPDGSGRFFICNTNVPSFIWFSSATIPTTSDWKNIITAHNVTDIAIGATTDLSWGLISMSMPDPDTLFFLAYGNNNEAIFKYSISADSVYMVSPDLSLFSMGFAYYRGKGVLAVSTADDPLNGYRRNIYFGWDQPYHSFDGGHTYTAIGTYWGVPTHGDIRGMYLQTASNSLRGIGDRLLVVDDGGVSLKYAGTDDSLVRSNATVNINGSGLSCGTFIGFSSTEAGGIGFGGMIHDGVNSFDPTMLQPWLHIDNNDSWVSCFDSNAHSIQGYIINDYYNDLDYTAPSGGRAIGVVGTLPSYPGLASQSPLGTDNYGDIYVGSDKLYRRTAGTTPFYSLAYLNFPDYSGGTRTYTQLAFSPLDTSFNGYAVRYNGSYDSPILYRNRFLLGYDFAQRINPVPGTVGGYYYISGIVTDPNNTQRVWVGQTGWYGGPRTSLPRFHVQYSINNGIDWVDISNGFPYNMPVLHLVFDNAANALYAATDVGIYKCDMNTYDPTATYSLGGLNVNTSVQWHCFNNGLVATTPFPNVDVNNLTINHCQGKLYAATYGRSVWSTDLYAPNINPTPDDTIWSNTTWTSDQYIAGGIDIQPCATLTIRNATIHMPKNGIIAIEPGGKLDVDNCTLTNDCSQCMWQGIEARGQVLQPQTAANQGWARITHSTIKHALIAATNTNLTAEWGADGGIIQCINDSFIDNQQSANFQTYGNFSLPGGMGSLFPNLSYFAGSTFLIDSNYKGDNMHMPMQHMVYMHGIEGISFTGCHFLNLDTHPQQAGLGQAIHALGCGFNVSAWCPGLIDGGSGGCSLPWDSCTFTGFGTAIDIEGSVEATQAVSIDQAGFYKNSLGVYVSVYDNTSITRSCFMIGNGKPIDSVQTASFMGCYQNVGIYQTNVNNFRIEQNSFNGIPITTSDWDNYGCVIVNSGSTNNTVYRCLFDGLTNGVLGIGNNTSEPAVYTTGLLVACNNFNNNADDIVSDPVPSGLLPQGICSEQQYMTKAANNFFAGGSTNNIYNNTSTIYYGYDASAPITIPATLAGPGAVYLSSLPTNACLSTIAYVPPVVTAGGGGAVTALAPVVRGLMQTAYYADTASLDTLIPQLTGSIDFGNFDSLLAIVDTETIEANMYNLLMADSMWLSEKILGTAASMSLLTYADMVYVLAANPDALRNPELLSTVSSFYALTAIDMITLETDANTITPRTTLQQNIISTAQDRDYNANMVLMALKSAYGNCLVGMPPPPPPPCPLCPPLPYYPVCYTNICTDTNSVFYLLDSTAYYRDYDSLPNLLPTIHQMWAQRALAGYYLYKGNYLSANALAANMDTIFAGFPQDTVNWNYQFTWDTLWSVLQSNEGNPYGEYSFNNAQIAALDTTMRFAVTENTAQQIKYNLATSLLGLHSGGSTTVGVSPFPCLIYGATDGIPRKMTHSKIKPDSTKNSFSKPKILSLQPSVQVSPNPTTGMVTFTYNVPQNGVVTITVSNTLGEKLMERYGISGSGIIQWDASAYPAGMYFYLVTGPSGTIDIGKIVRN